MTTYLVSTLSLIPLFSSMLVLSIKKKNINIIRYISIFTVMLNFFISLFLWIFFDKSSGHFQFCEVFFCNFGEIFFGVDGISLFFILLTTFLIPFCVLSNWYNIKNFKEYVICFLIIESFLIIIFSTLNVLVFFIFFESILIPMFVLIGLFGSGRRKVRSGYFFFFYTFISSILMLLSIGFIYLNTGTLNYQILINIVYTKKIQKLLWIGFIVAFITKIPVVPFHLWLPEAHVEAPTEGSVLLAGILLKLGTYGILRFLLPLFKFASMYFSPLIFMLGGISIIYASGVAVRQTDLKRVIAYTSIAHMNLVLIGLFSFNLLAISGGIFQMLSHGLVSSALFFSIGFLYKRLNTRIIENLGGLTQILPKFSFLFFIFILANTAFPCTSNFVGELILLIGIFFNNFFICLICITSMVFSGSYSLWVYNRIFFGNLKNYFINDLTNLEFFILFTFFFFILFFGILPENIFSFLEVSVAILLENFIN